MLFTVVVLYVYLTITVLLTLVKRCIILNLPQLKSNESQILHRVDILDIQCIDVDLEPMKYLLQ